MIPPEDSSDPRPEPTANEEGSDQSESYSPPPEGDAKQAFEDLGESFRRAWRAGTSDARRNAKDAIPRAREDFAKGLHDLTWGAAYVVSFGVTLAREIAPDCVDQGWQEGSDAGRKAAESFAEKNRKSPETSEEKESGTEGDGPVSTVPA